MARARVRFCLPTARFHRLLVQEGNDIVVMLPELFDASVHQPIAALPGNCALAEQTAFAILAGRPDLAPRPARSRR